MFSKKIVRLVVYTAISLTAIFFLLQPASSSLQPQSEDRELYAVIVGVGKYEDPNIPALTRSVKDARDFYAFLKEREHLFPRVNMTLLLNEQATRANVAQALRQELRPADSDDIVIIYLSGHGLTEPTVGNEYYFATYDARLDNLFGTALLMNDTNLFKGVKSNNVFLLTDACHSGGFNPGLDKLVAKSANRFFSIFDHTTGRVAMSSSRPEEESYEKLVYGNSIFTHFLLKGLRGAAVSKNETGTMTVYDLYHYVSKNTKLASKGLQNPQLYAAKGVAKSTPVFLVAKSAGSLDIKVQFFYESENQEIKPISDGSILKSGQHVGIAFRPQSDCFVYIYWWDSSGKVGRLFPNPRLTEGTGRAVAGKTHWLPYKDGERWYVLDENPGTETIYFVASRARNPKLEELYNKLATAQSTGKLPKTELRTTPASNQGPPQGTAISLDKTKDEKLAQDMKRELSLMGFADYTVAKGVEKASFSSKESLFEELESKIRVSGAEAVFKLQFKHVAK